MVLSALDCNSSSPKLTEPFQHNYLASDPSRQTAQMIRLNYNSTASDGEMVTEVKTFGSHQASGNLNLSTSQFDYYSYVGDTAVRKFPFSPLRPFNETISII